VRSGDELHEKCREIAIHFETQGTPVMIGTYFSIMLYTAAIRYNKHYKWKSQFSFHLKLSKVATKP
jgi:hypothetical protein